MISTFRNRLILILLTISRLNVCYAQMTIVNAASLRAGQPLAPSSFASIFGEGLCPQTVVGGLTEAGQFPTTLGECSLMVGGTPAMMQYVSPGQVNFLVPQSVSPGNLSVTLNNGSNMVSGSMAVGPAGPGMFAMTGMGMGQAAMLHGTLWTAGPFSTTTNGQTTPVAIYVTGLDLLAKPAVSIGGVPAEVMWWGNVPNYPGLQQINISLPMGAAGVGSVPVTVTSSGVMSNVTYMTLLPTSAMMAGMPGWGTGMMVQENMPRAHEMAYVAFNPGNNTALVTDANDDVVRVISLVSNSTIATITLPRQSVANAIAIDPAGQYAAVALSAQASIALLDLSKNQVTAVIGTGYYPSHAVFSGSNLLVTNGASGTVSVIDVASRVVTHTVNVGFGPSGIAVSGNTAVVANFQEGSLSLVNLTDFTGSTVKLPAGSRPHEVAISANGQAVVTNPMSNGVLLFNLSTKTVTAVDIGIWNAMGPGAVVTNGSFAYIANQMTSGVTVLDLNAGSVVKTFSVDPGPRALAVIPGRNQLLVLSEGTGTLDVFDLATSSIVTRLNAGDSERSGTWTMPFITSMSPTTAPAGSTFTLTVNGSNFQGVKDIEFHLASTQAGGMMGGAGMMGAEDSTIKVSNLHANASGTQINATVQILSAAAAGPRQVRIETDWGEIMGMTATSLFAITSR